MVNGVDGAEEGVGLAGLALPPDGVFEEFMLATAAGWGVLTWLEDVIPCLWLGKCYFVGGDTQDWSVDAMELLDIVDDCAFEKCSYEG